MADRTEARVDVSTREGGVIVITPRGDIGTAEAPSLQTQVRAVFAQRPRRVVIDLAHVPYMATAGLATLVEAMQMSKKTGSQLYLCTLQDRVRAVFEISKLTTVFRIADSVDGAISAA